MELIMPNKDPVLSFEEFCKVRDNIHLYFVPEAPDESVTAFVYHQKPAYVKCIQKIPLEFGRVARALERMTVFGATNSEKYLRKLYRAYRMMHDNADEDKELFP